MSRKSMPVGGTFADSVLEQIQNEIVTGVLSPGSKLSEADLAGKYGVSRGPLREALRRLESRKLIVRAPHVGAKVIALTGEDLYEILQVREALEGLACRLAAENMTDEEIEGLRQLMDIHSRDKTLKEGRAYFQEEGDLDFHYRIARGSKNSHLIRLLCGELYQLIRMYRYQFSTRTPGRPKQAFYEHQLIIDAIADRDGEMAELLMRNHIGRSRKKLLKNGALQQEN